MSPHNGKAERTAKEFFEKLFEDYDTNISAVVTSSTQVIGQWFSTSSSSATPTNSKTIFPIGSVTKTVTALLAEKLRCKGVLDFEASIFSLRPFEHLAGSVPTTMHAITISHLLTHSSGLPRDLKGLFFEANVLPEYSDLEEFLRNGVLFSKPGEVYKYSNIGYAILGLIIEAHLAESKLEMLNEILGERAFYELDQMGASSSLPDGQNRVGEKVFHYQVPRFNAYGLVGGLAMDSEQISNYLRFNLCGTKSDQEDSTSFDVRSLHRPRVFADDWSSASGLAWRIIPSPFGLISAHSGSVPGYSTSFVIAPGLDLGVAVSATSEHFFYPRIVEFLEQVAGACRIESTSAGNTSESLFQLVAGQYQWLDEYHSLELAIEDDHLVVPNSEYYPLVAQTRIFQTDSGLKISGGLYDGEYLEVEWASEAVKGVWLGGLFYEKVP